MKNNRIVIAGLDKAANNELAKNLINKFGGLVQSEHEFQKAIETGDKNNWLNLFVEQEQLYHQTLIILWMSDESLEKRGTHVTAVEKVRVINYANEMLFEGWGKKNMNEIGTKVYFVRLGAKARYQEVADFVMNSIENDNIPSFSVESPETFVWTAPNDIMELTKP